MISESYRVELNKELRLVASKLDLDETRYQNAEEKYQAIGNWLNAENSSLAQYSPQIYPQGSFLLGTVVKPLSSDEYDIDLVCLLSGIRQTTRSHKVKEMIGERLMESERYSKMIEEMNRCWRLHYAGEFHMDIIPAIPDNEEMEDAILVPDRELAGWTWSNPKGYAEWFRECMQSQYELQKRLLAETYQKDVEDIPDYLVKTELQLVMQLMKRHRDIMFEKEHNDKPISIIITTLAAHVYQSQRFQEDLFETLKISAANMPSHIINKNGELWVTNPINPDENFADKWSDHPERKDAFYRWIDKLKNDLSKLESGSSLADSEEVIGEMFGEGVVLSTIKAITQVEGIKVVPNHFDVPYKQHPASKWKMSLSGEVSVRGYIQSSKNNTTEFPSDSTRLDKGLSIYFLARSKNIERPYEVHWQIVNTGKEAVAAGDLRGGFDPSTSPTSHRRNEFTSYTGMHWIEAYIIKDGICVARSGEFVVKIK